MATGRRTIDMKLDVDTKKGTAAIKKVKTATSNFSKSAVKDAKKVSKAWDKASKSFKKISIVVAASVASFAYLAKKSLDAADKIAKLSDSIGISTTKLQEYNYAAGLSGVSTEELNSALVAFTKRLGEAKTGTGALSGYLKNSNKALLDQLKNVDSASQGLDVFMKALGDTETATDKAALAAAAFGRGAGVKMTVMVKDGADALDLMKKEAHDLGLILDGELLRNAERLNDDMSKLSQVVSTQFTKAILELAPEIEKVAKDMLKWVKANKELIGQKVGTTIGTIEEALKKIWTIISYSPAIIEWGLLGLALFGKQGAVVVGGLAHISVALINIGRGIDAVKRGSISLSDFINADFKELEKMLDKVKPPPLLQRFEEDAERLREKIKDLKKREDDWFFLPSEKKLLARLQSQLRGTEKAIKHIKKAKEETKKIEDEKIEDEKRKEILSKKIATAEAWAIYKYDLDQRMLNATGQTQEAELNILKQNMATEIKEYGLTEDKITKIKEVFTAEKKVIDDKYTAQHADNLQKNVDLAQSISDQTTIIYGNMYDQISLGLDQSSTGLQTWGELWVDIGQKMNDQLAGAFTDNLWDVIEGTKNGEEAFKAFGKTVISWLSKAIIKQTMLYLLDKTGMDDRKKALTDKLVANKVEAKSVDDLTAAYIRLNIAKGIGSLFGGGAASSGGAVITPNANGNVYNQGGMAAYANGGVVSTPTNFAFGNGNIGLLGEAGAESIMPLGRTPGGELGVKSTGDQQQPNQTVIINAVDTKSFADALQRNPAGIISIVNEALQDRGVILDTIRQTL